MSQFLSGASLAPLVKFDKSAAAGANPAITSYAASAFRTIGFNTEVEDLSSLGSIASNAMTLAAGTYDYLISGHLYVDSSATRLIVRLRNTTDNTTETSKFVSGSSYTVLNYVLSGRLIITASKVFEVQVYSNQIIYNTDGTAISTGERGVWHSATFKKVA